MTLSTESFWSEIKSYEERLKNNPASYCFASLVDVYLRAGLLDDALATARAGVVRYPGFVAGQMALARVCHQKGLVDECRIALEVVTGAVPEHSEAQRMLARLYAESGRGQEACRALQTLLEFCPDDMTATLELESLQRRFAADLSDDELELIEFTDADIFEEFEGDDLLVERVKPVASVVEDPWAGVAAAQEFVPEPAFEPAFVPEPDLLSVQAVADLDSVWSVPEQQIESAAKPENVDPLTTPTMAELYVSQGFPEKAIGIYQKIVESDSSNLDAAARLAELEKPTGAIEAVQAAVAAAEQSPVQVDLPVQGAADQQAKVTVLEGWLENIRRLRTCR